MTTPASASAAQPAHHRPGGGFQNPWNDRPDPGFRQFLKWVLVERPLHGRPPDPPRTVFVRATPAFATPRAPADRTVLTWVGHSTFQIGRASCRERV